MNAIGRIDRARADLAAAPAPQSRGAAENDVLPGPVALPGLAADVAGDLGLALARLLMRRAADDDRLALAERHAAERAEDDANRRAVAALHDKADATFASAVVGGVMKAMSGAATFASGAMKLDADDATTPDARRALARGANGAAAAASVAEGMGRFVSGAFDAAAVDDDARAKNADHDASVAAHAQNDARHHAETAAKLASDALVFVREYASANAATMHAAAQRA
jgi:colicin import membrane protein